MYNTTQQINDVGRIIKVIWYGLLMGAGVALIMFVVMCFGIAAGIHST